LSRVKEVSVAVDDLVVVKDATLSIASYCGCSET